MCKALLVQHGAKSLEELLMDFDTALLELMPNCLLCPPFFISQRLTVNESDPWYGVKFGLSHHEAW